MAAGALSLLVTLVCVARAAAADGSIASAPSATAEPRAVTRNAEPVPDAVRAGFGDIDAWRRLLERGEAALSEIERQIGRLERALARLRALRRQIAPERREEAASPWHARAIAEAERRMAVGDHLGAIKLLDAVSTLHPPTAVRRQVSRLRIEARSRYVREAILAIDLHPERRLVAPGETLRFVVELRSNASETLRLRPKGARRWPGQVEIEVLIADLEGNMFRHKVIRRIALEVPEELGAGKRWRTVIELGVPPDRFAPEALRRVVVRGALRPERIERGAEVITAPLVLLPTPLVVAPKRFATLGQNAPAELTLALTQIRHAHPAPAPEAERRAFYAALLAPPASQPTLLRILARALEKENDPAAPLAITILRALTDHPEIRTPTAWRRFLRR